MRANWVRSFVAVGLVTLFAAGCGTLLYPERRGQPPGRIDVGVVALDAIGMLFFFVPGVIAFAVDFATGAIYLPPEPQVIGSHPVGRSTPEQWSQADHWNVEEWRKVEVSPAGLSRQAIEQTVQAHTGEAIHLDTGSYQACPIDDLAESRQAYLRLASSERRRMTDVKFRE